MKRKKQLIFTLSVLLAIILAGGYLLARSFFGSHLGSDISIVLVTIDALRADRLGCYGNRPSPSPTIDDLAEKGVIFTQAVSQASWTQPSIHSIVTSTYPSTHRVFFWDQALSDDLEDLPLLLRRRGYATGLFSAHPTLSRAFGREFDRVETVGHTQGVLLNKKALGWLRQLGDRPFFLWIHYMDCHDSCTEKRIKGLQPDPKKRTQKDVQGFFAAYDEGIKVADGRVKALAEGLRELKRKRSPMLIISADHGQQICERDLCLNHGTELWETLIHVPLIIALPGSRATHARIDQQVQLIDLAPTICELLGLEQPGSFEGRSLVPLIEGRAVEQTFAFSEHVENNIDFSVGTWVFTKQSIRTPTWKLIATIRPVSEQLQLFHLPSDPAERKDLSSSQPKALRYMKENLDRWLRRVRPDVMPVTMNMDDEIKNQLRALGYIQ